MTDRPAAPSAPADRGTGGSARLVATGILLSRIAGLIRERVFAQYFSTTLYADAFRAALRMPNALQNLLGEGTLSASFIPVYAELLEQKREREAGRVAGAVFALLLAIAGGLSLLGILFAPAVVRIFSPGFEGLRRELTIAAVRIIFPMTGVLVLSAWALGVLNSHRRFFIPYTAPVLWNAAMIATLVFLGGRMALADLTVALAWGALVGGVLQFTIQLPWVLRVERQLRIRWDLRLEGVRTALRNAGPAILGRGVVQLSGYLDIVLASFLPFGAVAALGYAQTLYLLPISLFGISVAAAELPELSRRRGGDTDVLQRRVNAGLRQIAVFVVPSVIGFLILGDVIVAALYETGEFGRDDTIFVWVVLTGYALGLLASTATRLYSSAFFALHDTRTPARVAVLRVVLAGGAGAALMFLLRPYAVAGHGLGPLGLTLAAGLAAWVEWGRLRRALRERLGPIGAGAGVLTRLFAAAVLGAAAGRALFFVIPDAPIPEIAGLRHVWQATLVLGVFGVVYVTVARILGVPEAAAAVDRVLRRLRR